MVKIIAAFSVVVWLGTVVPGRAQGADDDALAAAAAFDAKDWTKSATLYERLALSHPANSRFWFRLGQASRFLGDPKKAREAYASALKAGLPMMQAGVALASAEVALGDRDKAFEHLQGAVEQGFSDPDTLQSEPALTPVRSDPRFAPLVERAKHNRTPCLYDAVNRQFDFWVGDWDVVATDGGMAQGTSHVSKEIGDCVIWENWTSGGTSGYFGKSYNVYNPTLKRWEQFWVDNQAGMIHFYGQREGEVMDYYTDDLTLPDGTRSKRRLRFFNLGPDTVRQFSQETKDGGKTWQVEYDFTYNRHKS